MLENLKKVYDNFRMDVHVMFSKAFNVDELIDLESKAALPAS